MAARSRRYFESACRWHTLATNWEKRDFGRSPFWAVPDESVRIYTIFSTSEIDNTRRHPFVSRSFGRGWLIPLATFTLQRLIHLYQLQSAAFQVMPNEDKAHRPSSRLLAHLNWALDEALEQTFPASDPVAIDIDRELHDREARVFDSCTPLDGKRKADHSIAQNKNANAHPPALKRTRRVGSKQTNCCASPPLDVLASIAAVKTY
jgi:hypothetical protein